MKDNKSWYSSQGVWANLAQILVGILTSVGLITTEMGAIITEQAPALIVTIITGVLGVWGLYGRVKATKKIGNK